MEFQYEALQSQQSSRVNVKRFLSWEIILKAIYVKLKQHC